MMTRPSFLRVIFILLSICIVMSGVSGLMSFYDGGLRMTDEMFRVEIGASDVVVVAVDYTLHNQGSVSETVQLSFPGAPQKYTLTRDGQAFTGLLTLASSASTTLRLSYTLPLGTDVHSLELHPELLFNGLADGNRIATVEGSVTLAGNAVLAPLPSGFVDAGSVAETHQYRYSASQLYQPSFSFSWLASDPHLLVTRDVSRVRAVGDTLTVTTMMKNTGSEVVRDILLQDSFLQANYMPLSDGFTFVASDFEPAYIWNVTFASLGAGEGKTFSYSLNVTNGVNLRTMPLVVLVDGDVVASVEGDFITLGSSLEEQLAQANAEVDDSFTTAPDRLALAPTSPPPAHFVPSDLRELEALSLWMKLLYVVLAIVLVVGGAYGVRWAYQYWQEHRSVSAPRSGVVPYRSVLR